MITRKRKTQSKVPRCEHICINCSRGFSHAGKQLQCKIALCGICWQNQKKQHEKIWPEKSRTLDLIANKKNPRSVVIYDRIISIVARKGQTHKCDSECRKVDHVYRHEFTKKHFIYGLPDGSVLIR